MEFTISGPVKPQKNPRDKYRLEITWSDAEPTALLTRDKGVIEDYIKIHDEYRKRLDAEWNDWCNVESYHIEKIIEELGLDLDIDYFFEEYPWAEHTEYDFLDMPESYKVTYFNEHGIEHKVNIKKDK